MGFSVPPRLRLERWALTPPFHPYPALSVTGRKFPVRRGVAGTRPVIERAGRFVFCGTFRQRNFTALLPVCIRGKNRGYTASHPLEFGLSSPNKMLEAILRLSKISLGIYPPVLQNTSHSTGPTGPGAHLSF